MKSCIEAMLLEVAMRNEFTAIIERDGRFLIVTELESTANEPIHVLLNWKPPK